VVFDVEKREALKDGVHPQESPTSSSGSLSLSGSRVHLKQEPGSGQVRAWSGPGSGQSPRSERVTVREVVVVLLL